MGELSVFCQSYFNKTLIGQAGSVGGKARPEIEVEQRLGVFWQAESSLRSSAQTTGEERYKLPPLEKVLSHVANIDKDNGVT